MIFSHLNYLAAVYPWAAVKIINYFYFTINLIIIISMNLKDIKDYADYYQNFRHFKVKNYLVLVYQVIYSINFILY